LEKYKVGKTYCGRAMSEDTKNEVRQLMMLISSIRATDTERYEEHIRFTNEVVAFIKKIQENMNQNWDRMHKNLATLNKTIEDSLDALLTGINPEGLKETSQSLKEIMDTMGKSIQSMNLENVMRELRMLTGSGVKIDVQKTEGSGKDKATPLKAGLSAPYNAPGQPAAAQSSGSDDTVDGLDEATIAAYKEAYGGQLPPHLLKQKPKKKESHLLKPSDFFGS